MSSERVEAAAKVLAEAYWHWDKLHENARARFRLHAKEILAAADAAAPQAVQAVDPWPQIRADFEYRLKAQGVNVSRLDSGAYLRPDVDRAWDALLRSYLHAQAVQSVGAAPAGYALVPVEPTLEMLTAASLADDKAFVDGSAHGATAEDIWAAMLSAAPNQKGGR